MFKIIRVDILSVLLATLMTGPCLAQPEASGARINLRAKLLLSQMAQAYRALRSYSSALDVVDTQKSRMPRPIIHSEIAFQCPSQAVVTTTNASDGSTITQAVADGQQFFVASASNPKVYLLRPYIPGADMYNVLGQGVGTYMPMPIEFMEGVNVLPVLYAPGPKPAIRSLFLGPEGVVGGVPVATVVFRSHDRTGQEWSRTFAIAKTDHLLRRLIAEDSYQGRIVTRTVTLSHIVVNAPLPASRFAFTSPPDATPVSSLNELYQDLRRHVVLKVGDLPPTFNTQALDGQIISPEQYKGKVLLLDFWATWCGPCQEEIPSVVRLYQKHQAQGLDIVGVAEDKPQDEARVKAVVQKSGMIWRQVRESDPQLGDIAASYGVGAIPFTVLIGRDGRIAAVNAHGKALEQAIIAALSAPA